MNYFLWFVIVVLGAVVVLLVLQRYTKLQFVTHAKLLWKTWSIWLGTLGTLLAAFPDAAITAWSFLPPDVKSLLPPSVVSFIGPFLMVMALMSQFVKQRKLEVQRKELEKRDE